MKTLVISLSLLMLTSLSSAYAQSAPADKSNTGPDPKITELLAKRLGTAKVSEPEITPAEGIYQTRLGNKFAYLAGNGRYVFIGDMIDLQEQVNITEVARRSHAKQSLASFAVEDMAVYPAKDQLVTVLNVFTDTSCPYCKKLHEEIPQLQDAGIEVRYLPFPRGGSRGPGYQDLTKVWCSKDKALGMDIAKGVDVGDLPDGQCKDSILVDNGFTLGNQMGVTGTPALITASGQLIEGYVPHKQLIPMLMRSALEEKLRNGQAKSN